MTYSLTPVAAEGFQTRIGRGWAGTQELPALIVASEEGPLLVTLWIVPGELAEFLAQTQAISVTIFTEPSGVFRSMSVTVPNLTVVEEQGS